MFQPLRRGGVSGFPGRLELTHAGEAVGGKRERKNPPAPSFYSQDNKSIRFISSTVFLEHRHEAQTPEERKREKAPPAWFSFHPAVRARLSLTPVLSQSRSSGGGGGESLFTVCTCRLETIRSRDRKRNWNFPKCFLCLFFPVVSDQKKLFL